MTTLLTDLKTKESVWRSKATTLEQLRNEIQEHRPSIVVANALPVQDEEYQSLVKEFNCSILALLI